MLDSKFVHVQEEFARLKAKFDAGTITSDEFEAALQSLIFEHEGRRWTVGASSGKWFASSGESWVEAVPPAIRPALPEHATATPHVQASTMAPAHPATPVPPPTHATPPSPVQAAVAGGFSEKVKMNLLRWGTVLLFVGAVSFVLPLIGMQFRLLDIFGEENQTPAAIGMIIVGGILIFIGRSGGGSSVAAAVPSGSVTVKHSHLLIGVVAILIAIACFAYIANESP